MAPPAPNWRIPQSPSAVSLLSAQSRSPPTVRNAPSNASLRSQGESRYPASEEGISTSSNSAVPASISDKFSMSPDPASWGGNISPAVREPDDELHFPDPKRDRQHDKGGTIFTGRGLVNLGCLLIVFGGTAMLFAGYPIISHFKAHRQLTFGAFNLGGTNASGQVPSIPGNWGVVDLETPTEVHTKKDYVSGKTWELIFSDEFNTDGRSFYPGDDPYWQAVDLHYWQTGNLEWYDPAAITTRNGSLEITLSEKQTHGLDYQGGMMTTWNKFCFTGGLVEASVVLPGANNILGLWPAIWTMGNLGRAGYGASLEGMWPYTYDSCDVGTLANQTLNGLPLAATEAGPGSNNGELSWLSGQRLSRCTCAGESHPGPVHSDGTYVGRAAPEIDVFEATFALDPILGQVSQSGQWAPFNADYSWFNTTDNLIIPDTNQTEFNVYMGGVLQQATSCLTYTNPSAYELNGNQYSVYGMQYQPGFDSAYIAWISDGSLVWQLNQPGMAADTRVEIGPRPVPQEPMYLIMNLGMSPQFGKVDLEHITFPTTMKVDWIRVYQDPDMKNIGCDPPDFPTAAYINDYIEAYTNPNLTTWTDDYGQPVPKNSFLGEC